MADESIDVWTDLDEDVDESIAPPQAGTYNASISSVRPTTTKTGYKAAWIDFEFTDPDSFGHKVSLMVGLPVKKKDGDVAIPRTMTDRYFMVVNALGVTETTLSKALKALQGQTCQVILRNGDVSRVMAAAKETAGVW